jgi:hypothetical protein
MLTSPDSVDFALVPMVRAIEHNLDHVVFRHESFTCLRSVGSRLSPNPQRSAPFGWESRQYRHRI